MNKFFMNVIASLIAAYLWQYYFWPIFTHAQPAQQHSPVTSDVVVKPASSTADGSEQHADTGAENVASAEKSLDENAASKSPVMPAADSPEQNADSSGTGNIASTDGSLEYAGSEYYVAPTPVAPTAVAPAPIPYPHRRPNPQNRPGTFPPPRPLTRLYFVPNAPFYQQRRVMQFGGRLMAPRIVQNPTQRLTVGRRR